jgi:hypothetical protein
MSQFKLTCQTRDSSYEIEITQKKNVKNHKTEKKKNEKKMMSTRISFSNTWPQKIDRKHSIWKNYET